MQGAYSLIEGTIDAVTSVVGLVGSIFDSDFDEQAAEFIEKDLTGSRAFGDALAEYGHDKVFWESN